MELKELRHFIRVARAGSVSRAAAELRIAQPALSRQIRKLEHDLGVALFTRYGRGVRLSTAGSLLLERAEAIAHLVQETREEIREDRFPSRGRVTLGVPPAAGRLIIPTFVERFQRNWPQVTLHMREGAASSLQEWLLDKRIDVAMLHNPPHLEALAIAPVISERMVLVGPPPRLLKGRKLPANFRFRDLADMPLILPNGAHNNRRLVEQVALEQGVGLRIKVEADSVSFAKVLVEQGLGYTILTAAAVEDEVSRRKLTSYPIVQPALFTHLSIVTIRDKQPRLVADACALLTEVCRALIRDKAWPGGTLA